MIGDTWIIPKRYGPRPDTEYWNVEDTEDWYNDAAFIQRLLFTALLSRVELIEVLPVDTRYIPYPSHFNKIERNLDRLQAGAYLGEFVSTRTWLGGSYDEPLMGWRDWNRWFEPLSEIKRILERTLELSRYTGTYASGGDALWQYIGRWRV